MIRQKYKNLPIILFLRNLWRVVNLVMENQFEEDPDKHHQVEEIPTEQHQFDDVEDEWDDWDEMEAYHHDRGMTHEELTIEKSKIDITVTIVFLVMLVVISSIFSAFSR